MGLWPEETAQHQSKEMIKGWWLLPSQSNAWVTFCGYIRQRKRIQIRLNPKSWKSSPRGFQMSSESHCLMGALCWQGRGVQDTSYGHEQECCPHSVTIPNFPGVLSAPAAKGLRAHGCFHAGHSLQRKQGGLCVWEESFMQGLFLSLEKYISEMALQSGVSHIGSSWWALLQSEF